MRTARSGNAAAAAGAEPRPGTATMAEAMTVRRRTPARLVAGTADRRGFAVMVGACFRMRRAAMVDSAGRPRDLIAPCQGAARPVLARAPWDGVFHDG